MIVGQNGPTDNCARSTAARHLLCMHSCARADHATWQPKVPYPVRHAEKLAESQLRTNLSALALTTTMHHVLLHISFPDAQAGGSVAVIQTPTTDGEKKTFVEDQCRRFLRKLPGATLAEDRGRS